MSSDGDGSETMEWQAAQIARNSTQYKGSAPCSECGIIMNPVQFMQSHQGKCPLCLTQMRTQRIRNKMS